MLKNDNLELEHNVNNSYIISVFASLYQFSISSFKKLKY